MKIHNSYSKWYCVKEWYSKWIERSSYHIEIHVILFDVFWRRRLTDYETESSETIEFTLWDVQEYWIDQNIIESVVDFSS